MSWSDSPVLPWGPYILENNIDDAPIGTKIVNRPPTFYLGRGRHMDGNKLHPGILVPRE